MPQVRRMQREGMTFRQFVVADSLCCSSRATILTGAFPHNTRVLEQHAARRRLLGLPQVRRAASAASAIALQRAGYRTALMGKYLNGYQPHRTGPIPAGTSGWGRARATAASATRMSDNGRAVTAGHRPRDYLTDVLARRAARFIRRSAARQPVLHHDRPLRARTRRRCRRRGTGGCSADLRAPAWSARSTRRDRPAGLARRRPPLTRGAASGCCGQHRDARPLGAGDRRADRPHPRHAATGAASPATRSSCSAPTTATTSASTA